MLSVTREVVRRHQAPLQSKLLLPSIQVRPHPTRGWQRLAVRRRQLFRLVPTQRRRRLIQVKNVAVRCGERRRRRANIVGDGGLVRAARLECAAWRRGGLQPGLEPMENRPEFGERSKGRVEVETDHHIALARGGGRIGELWRGLAVYFPNISVSHSSLCSSSLGSKKLRGPTSSWNVLARFGDVVFANG